MLNEFKTNFFGGTRSNRFLIEGNIPTSNGEQYFTPFHIRSTIIPQLVSTTMSFDFFGRKYHYPGEKQYSTWSFTVLDDTGDNSLWKHFHDWQNTINNNQTNVSSFINRDTTYKTYGWKIKHLDMNDDKVLKTFIMHGCWPAQVGQIALNMTSPNTMSSFNVLVVYDYIELMSNDTYITTRT